MEYGTRDASLVKQVLSELQRLRSAKGPLRPEGIVHFPALYGLASQTNAIDCWRWLNDVARSGTRRNHFVEAARLHIFGDGADVLARLTNAGELLGRDQRTIRTWSDRGLPELAQTLVDGSYLAGSRAMHFVDLQGLPDPASPSGAALRIFWCGHQFLRGEGIDIYACDPSLGPEADDFTELGELFHRLEPAWEELIPARGAFTVYCRYHLQLPRPDDFDHRVLTFVFGKQSTQFVRITDPPDMPGCTVRVSVFRQGVSFWFDRDRGADDNHFDWGHPIQF